MRASSKFKVQSPKFKVRIHFEGPKEELSDSAKQSGPTAARQGPSDRLVRQSGENCFFPSPVRGDMSLECIGTNNSGPTAWIFKGKTFHGPDCTRRLDTNAESDPFVPQWIREGSDRRYLKNSSDDSKSSDE